MRRPSRGYSDRELDGAATTRNATWRRPAYASLLTARELMLLASSQTQRWVR